MQAIYKNFDLMEISFQGAVAASIIGKLFHAKNEAIKTRTFAYTELGPNKLKVMVNKSGARGGYTYQFDTGPDGEIWLIGDRDVDSWNIRVHVKSLCLALYGYEKAKEKVLKILLKDLMAKGPKDNERKPRERISRVDYCVDFLVFNGFVPDPINFVCSGTTKKAQYGDISYYEGTRGRSTETVTVGRMPNRQVTIYNKLKEISRSKKYWFQIWGLKELEIIGQIWRVEVRAPKKELNKWNLRSFKDFEKKIGDVIADILNHYKYTTPNPYDSNQSRWPLEEIWQQALKIIETDLLTYISKANRNEVMVEIQELAINRYKKLISGIMVGYSAIVGKDISEMPTVMEYIYNQILEDISNNPEKFRQKHQKFVDKFSFLNEKK